VERLFGFESLYSASFTVLLKIDWAEGFGGGVVKLHLL